MIIIGLSARSRAICFCASSPFRSRRERAGSTARNNVSGDPHGGHTNWKRPFHFTMTKSALWPSAELGPIHTVALAGSTRSCISMFQKASSFRPMVKSTRCDSPGANVILRNPSSSLTGRAMLVPRMRRYSSTTSSPARLPEFFTVVDTCNASAWWFRASALNTNHERKAC